MSSKVGSTFPTNETDISGRIPFPATGKRVSSVDADVLMREREFFDRESAQLQDRDLIMPRDVIERYRNAGPSRFNIPKDTLFHLINPLAGKRVLDYGCGAGENTVLLAACGAEVTAFDLSPVSIERAKRRAQLMGLSERTRFDVAMAGYTGYPDGSFDIIAGFSVLHHVHMDLDRVYAEIHRLLADGGTAYFIEPVANNSVLRALRRLVPVSCEATPDERQLQTRDFEALEQHGFTFEVQYFYCLTRLYRIFGERARRPLRWLDYLLVRIPFMTSQFGMVLVTARRTSDEVTLLS